MNRKPLDPPDVEPIDALRAVNETWRRAVQIATDSWLGPNWGADYFAAELKYSLKFLELAGVDVARIVQEWRLNYDAYVALGGRMKYRSLDCPIVERRPS